MAVTARQVLPLIILVLAVFLAFLLLRSSPDASSGKSPKAPVLSVEVLSLESQDFMVEIESFGVLEAKTQTRLFPLVSGQVKHVSDVFENGAFFKKADVLLEIEPTDYEIEVKVAEGNVAQAELSLAEEQARHEQAKRDWQKQRKPELATDLALRLPQLKAANASLETARAQLQLAKLNLNRTIITAPYDGRVLQASTDVGSFITQNTQIGEIYSSDVIELRLPIANKDLAYLKVSQNNSSTLGLDVRVESELFGTREIWQAEGVRTEAAVDESTHQLYLVAEISNPFDQAKKQDRHELKIGQYVSAIISGETISDVIVIPNAAIYQGSYVYTVKDNLLYRTEIEVRWRNESVSIISSGLAEGDLLVTTLLGQVISGTKVKLLDDNAPGEDS